MKLNIKIVKSPGDLRHFIRFPYLKYRRDPFWVPPLLLDQKTILNRRKHPFYLKADAEFFLAEKGGAVCGRIAAIQNHAYTDYTGHKRGFFGFFEVEDNADTARALLDVACNWCAGRGLAEIHGPENPSTNYTCGLLMEGFDRLPVFMMPYNPPYYETFLEKAGFSGKKDLLAYWLTDKPEFPAKLGTIADRILERSGVTIRRLEMSRFQEEMKQLYTVYNDAWSRNWGFVPMSSEEREAIAAELKWVLDPRIILIAEKGDEPIGFLIGLPDLNQIFSRMNGRLFPLGWYQLLRGRHRQHVMRVIAMGFRKKFQNLGYAAAIYRDIIRLGRQAGYDRCEISWVLSDNVMMNRAAAMLGAEIYKKYRIFGKTL